MSIPYGCLVLELRIEILRIEFRIVGAYSPEIRCILRIMDFPIHLFSSQSVPYTLYIYLFYVYPGKNFSLLSYVVLCMHGFASNAFVPCTKFVQLFTKRQIFRLVQIESICR